MAVPILEDTTTPPNPMHPEPSTPNSVPPRMTWLHGCLITFIQTAAEEGSPCYPKSYYPKPSRKRIRHSRWQSRFWTRRHPPLTPCALHPLPETSNPRTHPKLVPEARIPKPVTPERTTRNPADDGVATRDGGSYPGRDDSDRNP
ncbi:hypothetical protein T484DRAFT_1740595 [Baffinella frigidus]|nr:hypothetical protein T484DRAFT_1740595 [Cryptophyta sp. CCMP2293]